MIRPRYRPTVRPLGEASQPGELAASTGVSSTAAPPSSAPITTRSEFPRLIKRAAATAYTAKQSPATSARPTPPRLTPAARPLAISSAQPPTAPAVATAQRTVSGPPPESLLISPANTGPLPTATTVPTATPVSRTAEKKQSW